MDFSAKERDLTEREKALSEIERVSTDKIRERVRDREREMDLIIYEILGTRNVISLRNKLEENELIFDRFLTDFVSQIPPLHIAIQYRSVDFAREILHRKPQLAYVLSSQGFSPLRMASANGSVDIVRELLPLIVDVSHDRDAKGWTPVHAAAMKGHVDVLKEFHETNPEWLRDITDRDETVLHLYVKYNNQVDALKMLIRLVGPDNEFVNRKDENGNTVLHLVAMKKDSPDNEFVNRKDENGNTILHLAAMKKDMEMITYLVGTETCVEINATNTNGFTALDVFALRPSNSADKKMKNELREKGAENSLKTSTEKAAKEKAEKEMRNVMILVGTLTATLCFQAALVPPGGLWQDDFNMGFNNCTMGFNNSSDNKNHTAGISILADKDPRMFTAFQATNYMLLSISLLVILRGALSAVRGGFLWILLINPDCVILIFTFGFVSAMIYLCNVVNTPGGFTPEIGRRLYVMQSAIFPAAPLFMFFYSCIILFPGYFYRLVRRAVARIKGSNVDTGTQQRS